MKAWVSGYAGVVHDFILLHYPASAMGTGYASNVQARIAGGEAGASYAFAAHWKADATLSYAWGENRTEHRPLPQMPPLEARFGLTWARDDLSVGALWRLAAAQRRAAAGEGNIVGQDLGPSAGFGVLSLNAGYRLEPSPHAHAPASTTCSTPPTPNTSTPRRSNWPATSTPCASTSPAVPAG